MIVDHLMSVIDADERLRRAYGNQPHFHYIVSVLIDAANRGESEVVLVRLLLHGLADLNEALTRSMQAHADTLSKAPPPTILKVDGSP